MIKNLLHLMILFLFPAFIWGDFSPIYNELPIHEAVATKITPIQRPEALKKKPPQEKIYNIPPKPNDHAVWVPATGHGFTKLIAINGSVGFGEIPLPIMNGSRENGLKPPRDGPG